MKNFITLICLMFLLNPVAAFAQDAVDQVAVAQDAVAQDAVAQVAVAQVAVAKKSLYVKAGAGFFNLEDEGLEFEYQGQEYDVAEISFDGGFNVHAAVGANLTNSLAVELEFGYNSADADKLTGKDFSYRGNSISGIDQSLDNDVSIKTLMVNGLYNLKNSSSFTPYAGVGIGFGWIDLESNGGDYSETNFAFQLLAGVEVELTNSLALTTGYRYLDAGEISGTGSYLVTDGVNYAAGDGEYSFGLTSHNFEAGLKYSF